MKLSCLLLSAFAAFVAAQKTILPSPAQRHIITAAQAQQAIAGAVAYSEKTGVPNDIAILDPFGQLVAFLRMDLAFIGSIDISIKKAKTSILFSAIPNYALYERALPPKGDLYGIEETNDGLVLFGGGQPIFDKRGYFIGAIGVSGGTVQQDIDTSTAGANAVGFTVSA